MCLSSDVTLNFIPPSARNNFYTYKANRTIPFRVGTVVAFNTYNTASRDLGSGLKAGIGIVSLFFSKNKAISNI